MAAAPGPLGLREAQWIAIAALVLGVPLLYMLWRRTASRLEDMQAKAYPGSVREASQAVRVLLTGSTRSPDLADVAGVLGPDEVLRRARAVVGPPG